MKLHEFFKLQEIIRRELGGEYAPQQLSILLLVSLRPGITHNEIADKLKMAQGSVSRNVSKLAKRVTEHSGVGYGLVENRQDKVYDTRRSAVWLTTEGKQLVAKIKKAIA